MPATGSSPPMQKNSGGPVPAASTGSGPSSSRSRLHNTDQQAGRIIGFSRRGIRIVPPHASFSAITQRRYLRPSLRSMLSRLTGKVTLDR